MQERSIGTFPIGPMPPLELRDCYLDGETTPLLRAGLTLRLRFSEDVCTGVIQPIAGQISATVSQQIPVPPPGTKPVIPHGPLREAVEVFTGGIPLSPILDLRQYRTPRSLNLGNTPIGIISLDVVSDETAARIGMWNTVEVELVPSAPENALDSIHSDFEARGIKEDSLTKFERGIMRRGASPDAPLLLLPTERELLEELLDSPVGVERRRAETILLTAEKLTAHEISRRVGLAPSRVRHWQNAFRTERLRVFDGGETDPQETAEKEPFTITPLVTAPIPPQEEERETQEEISDDFWVPIEDNVLYGDPEPQAAPKEKPREPVRPRAEVPRMEFSPYSSLVVVARSVIRQALGSIRAVGENATVEDVERTYQMLRLVPLVLKWLGVEGRSSAIADTLGYLQVLREYDKASALLDKETENETDVPFATALAKIVLGVKRRKAIRPELLADLDVELSMMSENLPETDVQLRHVLGSSLWSAVERVSLFPGTHELDVLEDAIGILEDHLRFLPSVPDELGHAVFASASIDECRETEFLARHVVEIADEWVEPDGTMDRRPLDHLQERLNARGTMLNERVSSRWEILGELPFRSAVAQSIAAL